MTTRRSGVSVLLILLLVLLLASGGTGAQAVRGQASERQSSAPGQKQKNPQNQKDGDEWVRRVIVLIPPRLETTTPQTQNGAEQAAAKIMSARKPRGKRRRRLFAPSGVVKIPPKAPPVKGTAGSAKIKPPATVPVEQRTALAQALFADMVTERVQERLGVVVATQSEVSAALNALHLTPADIQDRSKPENGRRLRESLRCQVILVPTITQCEIKDGLTRDVTLYARILIEKATKGETAAITAAQNLSANRAEKQSETLLKAKGGNSDTRGGGKLEPEGVSAAQWPVLLDVAGVASAAQVLFHQQYQKPQGDLLRDAAQQAVSLLVHTLRTGEQAPFMRPSDRLVVSPVFAPAQTDKLVFTKTGRRVQLAAVRGLSENVSGLFTPDLRPLPAGRILETEASESKRPPATSEQAANTLWNSLWHKGRNGKDETLPDVGRVQILARRVGADYALLARVTDIEVSEGASDPATLVSNAAPAEAERAVRVEAVAVLVRVSDGAILWQDRATSTTTAPLGAQGAAGSASSEKAAQSIQPVQSMIHDATRFALIELQRRLRHYRAQFEK